MNTMIENSEATQREQCAGVDFLSHTCIVCEKGFNPRQHNQVTCGSTGCRFGRQRREIRAAEHEVHDGIRWQRRRAKSIVDFLSATLGTNSRDNYKEQKSLTIDKQQIYSRCRQCGNEFTTPSQFAFCGESLLVQGVCKNAWKEALPVPTKAEPKNAINQPLDEERLANTKRVKAPKLLHLSRRKLNFCPRCKDYVNQDHECTI